MSQPILAAQGLSRNFPVKGGLLNRQVGVVPAVSDVSFSVETGETLGIVGESGCGKSTLARLLVQLEPIDAGEIHLQGERLAAGSSRAHVKSVRRRVQMVFQDSSTSLNPRMTVQSIIAYGPRIHGASRERANETARKIMEAVGLAPARFAQRYPHELSGGQKQRVNIARALAISPEVVVLDESVSALDKSVEAQILNLLQQLKRELNLTYLFISHDLHTVRYMSDRVMVMYLGRIVEMAPAQDLYAKPLHPYTRALLRSRLSPKEVRPLTEPLAGELPSPLNLPSGCHFRTRCPFAEPVCASRPPQLLPYAEGRKAACHIHDPAAGHSLNGRTELPA